MQWNIPTIIGVAVIAAILIAIAVNHIRNKKAGKGSCSCGCSCDGCGMQGACHSAADKKADN